MNTKTIAAIALIAVVGIGSAAVLMEQSARERSAAYLASKSASAPTSETVPVQTASPVAQDKPASATEACGVVGKYARTIMAHRQEGASMAEMMERSEKADPSIRSLSAGIIVMAFDRPRFSSQEYVDGAVSDFENEIYLECIKARMH
jgi:hypothetical protein